MAWQDIYLAICFGRRPIESPSINFSYTTSKLENLDYKQCLRVLSETVIAMHQPFQKEDVLEDVWSSFRNLTRRTLPHLQGQDQCRSIQNRIEYFAFRIQSSFVATSLSLREARYRAARNQEEKAKVVETCQASCSHTIQAFLDMHTFTVIPLRTWTFLHNALASALLIGMLASQEDAEGRALQSSLLTILLRSEEERVTPQNFRKFFGRALDSLKRMASGSYQSERKRGHDREPDTEM